MGPGTPRSDYTGGDATRRTEYSTPTTHPRRDRPRDSDTTLEPFIPPPSPSTTSSEDEKSFPKTLASLLDECAYISATEKRRIFGDSKSKLTVIIASRVLFLDQHQDTTSLAFHSQFEAFTDRYSVAITTSARAHASFNHPFSHSPRVIREFSTWRLSRSFQPDTHGLSTWDAIKVLKEAACTLSNAFHPGVH